jgi:hypothetical protein
MKHEKKRQDKKSKGNRSKANNSQETKKEQKKRKNQKTKIKHHFTCLESNPPPLLPLPVPPITTPTTHTSKGIRRIFEETLESR